MNFKDEVSERIASYANEEKLMRDSRDYMEATIVAKYSYNFSWMGLPIIQYPQDMVAMQEIIWSVQPDLIIEAGIARGGSLIFYASLLELIASSTGREGYVLGIDVDIRKHNRENIEAHPMFKRIEMVEGSSTDQSVIDQVVVAAKGKKRVLVALDSNHTHDHVLAELQAYAPLVTVGSYCVVFDTIVEDIPKEVYPDRPWGPGDNPKTAVWKYLEDNNDFEIDETYHNKLMITVSPDGYLKRVQ